MVTQNPNLIPPKQMEASMTTSTSSKPLFSEVFKKVHNAKVKAKKIEVLKSYDTPGLRRILKGAFDPRIVWELPPGTPPFMANEAPAGTQHKKLNNMFKGLSESVVKEAFGWDDNFMQIENK